MSATEETQTRAKGKRQNKSTPTPRKSTPVSARRKNGETDDKVDGDSAKKLNIFHYFGGGGGGSASAATPTVTVTVAPRTPPTSKQPSKTAARAGSAGSGAAKRRKSGSSASVVRIEEVDVASSAPSWGKLVDPRKQRRWELLRRLQEGGGRGGAGAGADPTAWARRSYCLSYAPVFNDSRPPGMGSTSEWGWGCQSQVFGGVRACLRPGPDSNAKNHAPDSGTSDRSSVGGHESTTGVEAEAEGEDKAEDEGRVGVAEAADLGVAWSSSRRRRRQDLQSKNFRTMVAWLSSSDSSRSTASGKTFLEIALERRDGGPAAAFMTLVSLTPDALLDEEEEGDSGDGDGDGNGDSAAAASHHDPVAFLLRLYHAGGTWRRVSKEPATRRHGRGSRLHPNDASLAAAVDEADERERYRRSTADHAAALVLLSAGLVVSLDAVASGGVFSRGGAADRGGGSRSGTVSDGPDPLVALALVEALTAAELRSLAKALGINTGVGAVDGRGKGGQGRRGSGGGCGVGGVDVKDDVCRALERWLTWPEDAAKRKTRLARAAREAAELVSAGRKESSRGGGGGGGGGDGGGSEVLVIRLADDAREVVQRVHTAFFASARHGPHDVSAVLREDLDRVMFGGGGDGDVGSEEAKTGGELHGSRPAPAVLSSVEAFAEFFRLVSLADGMEMAARAGDSGLAYGSLHEASTALLPSGCPLCRRHLVSQREREESNECCGAVAVTARLPHCDICVLSAKVVMRGVGLMERDKDYNNAFHYLEILLQAASQRLSVHRPQYWLRLVTDLGHKKRAMEALQACEKALAEACPCPTPDPKSTTSSARAAATATTGGGAGEEEAAILPLGEALPLIRRAVRLAVPPLRWRKRPPPELREAALRVMSLDLSWRRVGKREREGEGEGAAAGADEGGGDELKEIGVGEAGGSVGETVGGSAGVAPGTSLEQAVLDTLLAELGPGWKGLHSENSICLGLFALLCWDALFAPLVPAAPVDPAAPAGRSRPSPPAVNNNIAVEPTTTAIAAKHPPDQDPPPQDSQDSFPIPTAAGPSSSGDPMAMRAVAAGQQAEGSLPVAAVAGSAQGRAPGPSSAGTGTANEEISRNGAPDGPGCGGEEGDSGGVFCPFPSPFQSEPADLMTPVFAARRRRLLEGVYAGLERGEAGAMIRRTWSRHHGKACTGLNWNLFPEGVEGWVIVASAIGPLPLSCVCRNLASNYWAWRHGLPDLFLWRDKATVALETQVSAAVVAAGGGDGLESSPAGDAASVTAAQTKKMAQTKVAAESASASPSASGGGVVEVEAPEGPKREEGCKWIEVKGPGDSLSCAQEAWIDSLVRAGADFVLLRVEDAAGLPR